MWRFNVFAILRSFHTYTFDPPNYQGQDSRPHNFGASQHVPHRRDGNGKRADGLTLSPWSRGHKSGLGRDVCRRRHSLCARATLPFHLSDGGCRPSQAREEEERPSRPATESVPVCSICRGDDRPIRGWCPFCPWTGRPTSRSLGRTTRNVLAHTANQPRNSARQYSQRGVNYSPKPSVPSSIPITTSTLSLIPQIHTFSIFGTMWMINQKCVFKIHILYYNSVLIWLWK
jgi:hypothetical protein